MIKRKVKYRTDKHRRVMELGINKAENQNQFFFTYDDLAALNISNIRKIVNELVDEGELFRYGSKNKAILVVSQFNKYYMLQNKQKIRSPDVDTIENMVREHQGYWSSLSIHNINFTIKHPNTLLYDNLIERKENINTENYGIVKKSKDGSTYQFYPRKTVIQYRSTDNPISINQDSIGHFFYIRLYDLYHFSSVDTDLCVPQIQDWFLNAVDVHRDLIIPPKPSFKPMNVKLPKGIKYVIYNHKDKKNNIGYGRFEFQLQPKIKVCYILDYLLSFDPITVDKHFSADEIENLRKDISEVQYYVYNPPDPSDPDFYKYNSFTLYNEEQVYENKAFS
jgi:hypothetical protein